MIDNPAEIALGNFYTIDLNAPKEFNPDALNTHQDETYLKVWNASGMTFYAYCHNDPINCVDVLGLQGLHIAGEKVEHLSGTDPAPIYGSNRWETIIQVQYEESPVDINFESLEALKADLKQNGERLEKGIGGRWWNKFEKRQYTATFLKLLGLTEEEMSIRDKNLYIIYGVNNQKIGDVFSGHIAGGLGGEGVLSYNTGHKKYIPMDEYLATQQEEGIYRKQMIYEIDISSEEGLMFKAGFEHFYRMSTGVVPFRMCGHAVSKGLSDIGRCNFPAPDNIIHKAIDPGFNAWKTMTPRGIAMRLDNASYVNKNPDKGWWGNFYSRATVFKADDKSFIGKYEHVQGKEAGEMTNRKEMFNYLFPFQQYGNY